MASNKKKLDEKHLKMLREMVALAHNKQCFDCHQRGPTYVNMTIGSYVCTACSGLLNDSQSEHGGEEEDTSEKETQRGLNPPHRVKSISMASFTPDEMEFIKCHGNEYCRKVWLGLYDNRLGGQTEGRDESKVKDFMTQKYERKRYYVAPTDSMKDEAKRMNESAITKAPGTKPLKSLLGENAPKLQVGNTQEEDVNITENPFEDLPSAAKTTETVSHSDLFEGQITVTETVGNPLEDVLGGLQSQIIQEQKAPVSATPPPIGSTPQSPGNQSLQSSKSSGSTAMDLLGDLGGDPFASSALQSHPPGGGGFADFGNFGSTATSSQPFSQGAPLQPSGLQSSQQQSINGFMSTPAPAAPAPVAGGGGDKYSNLSDLFSVATTAEETSSTGTGLNWSGGSGGINWGGESNSTSTGGVNWNSSSTQIVSSSSGMNWGGSSVPSSSISWGGVPATAQSNVANPFGGGATSLTSQSGMAGVSQSQAANPFGGQPVASTAGFGAFGAQNTAVSQNTGFGQFGAPSSTAGAGFGQFGTPASSGAGFGHFGGVQNGGFGANTTAAAYGGAQTNVSTGFGVQQGFPAGQAGFGAQPQQQGGFGAFGGQPGQGFPQQQAGFGGQPAQMQGFGGAPAGGGWGQMPASSATVNPFMSTAQQYSAAPKTGTTNPFL